MKSEWRVAVQIINYEKKYAAYRILDINEPDHSGNREYAGGYIKDEGLIKLICNQLNDKENASPDGNPEEAQG